MRAAGIILLAVSLISVIYAAAVSGQAWIEFSAGPKSAGIGAGLAAGVRFHGAYFRALSGAVLNRELPSVQRTAAISGCFRSYLDHADAYDQKRRAADSADALLFFREVFSYRDFLDAYALHEHIDDIAELQSLTETLDAIGAPAARPGKAIFNTAAVSGADAYRAAYDRLHAEHGGEAGTYLEFMRAFTAMIRLYADAGNALSSAASYLDTVFTYDAYLEALDTLHLEEFAEFSGSVYSLFIPFAQEAAYAAPDTDAFFRTLYREMETRYPAGLPDFEYFMPVMADLLGAEDVFDGSYATVYRAAQNLVNADKNASFSVFLSGYVKTILSDAAANSAIAFSGALFGLIARYPLTALAGLLCLAASVALHYLAIARLMKKKAGNLPPRDPEVLLEVINLKQYFRSGDFFTKAVDGISFHVKKGEVFGLVGESGCGKTTTGRVIINLYEPTQGDIFYHGMRISSTRGGLSVLIRNLRVEHAARVKAFRSEAREKAAGSRAEKAALYKQLRQNIRQDKRALREQIDEARVQAYESYAEKAKCAELYQRQNTQKANQKKADVARGDIMSGIQMIFQDPIASIDPRMTVREIIAEGLIIRGIRDKAVIEEKVFETLELVGLVREHADRYPHEFSGGQRQRIGIARAIVLNPNLIIADEPISALDVSVQAQIINLLNELREKMGLTMIFIAHNLAVVKYFSERIAVMYGGKIVEMAAADELFSHPYHPYTQSLLSAIPYPDPLYEKQRRRIEYQPALAHNYSVDKPSAHEIVPGHFLYCNQAELDACRAERGL